MKREESKYINMQQVMFITCRAKTTLWRMIREEDFPRPVQLAQDTHANFWSLKEVRTWAHEIANALTERADRYPEQMSKSFNTKEEKMDITSKIAVLLKCR